MTPPRDPSRPEMVAAFIEETLTDLAELAVQHGYRALASTLIMAALEAARAAAGPPDPAH